MTENRLYSAISKIGYRSTRQSSKGRHLFHLFMTDIIEQLEANQPALFAALTKAQRVELLNSIKQEVRTLLKQYFQQETRRV